MIQPRRAVVRPRAIPAGGGEILPLEEHLQPFLEGGAAGVVQLLGPPGSGKTTAREHLAAVLPEGVRVTLLDEQPASLEQTEAAAEGIVVCASERLRPGPVLAVYRLAPWGADDLIEYLLARHKERCASVMGRVRPQDYLVFRGLPDLWQAVLEQMAPAESIRTTRQALYSHLESLLPDTDLLERSRSVCLNLLTTPGAQWPAVLGQQGELQQVPGVVRALRHPAVQVLLAADRIAADLAGE